MVTSQSPRSHTRSIPALPPGVSESVQHALEGLRYGQIVIKIHEGDIVQVERVDRIRFDQERAESRRAGIVQ